jgi:hypothetical protein
MSASRRVVVAECIQHLSYHYTSSEGQLLVLVTRLLLVNMYDRITNSLAPRQPSDRLDMDWPSGRPCRTDVRPFLRQEDWPTEISACNTAENIPC